MTRTAFLMLMMTAISSHLAEATQPDAAPTARPALRIVLVGDSTVTEREGWGAGFAERAAPGVEIVNFARGGRSSKSYRNEGWWTRALAARGDYILIQFGHNDCPGKGPDRETDPATTYRDNLRQHIAEARAAGATPVLITSLTRRRFDAESRIQSDLTAYADAAAAVASEMGVSLVDLHASSIAICNRIGPAECERLSPPPAEDGKKDATHLNLAGSRVFADAVIEGLVEAVPALRDRFRERAGGTTSPVGAAGEPRVITVSAEGYGDHRTVQAAVDAAVALGGGGRVVIRVAPGTYDQRIRIARAAPPIALVGEDAERTVLTGALTARMIGPDGREIGTFGTATVYVDSDDFTAEGITFENTAGEGGQALAISVSGDRATFRRCRFLGWQDTVFLTKGRSYLVDCLVQGHCDYIFGDGMAVFERCRIHSLSANYITAASTPAEQPFGFVFHRCQFTDDGKSRAYYLGRPWRPHAAVALLQCELPATVNAAGWHNWNKPESERTARYVEFANTGPGARPAERAGWSRQLSPAEAAAFNPGAVLAGRDGWNPSR